MNDCLRGIGVHSPPCQNFNGFGKLIETARNSDPEMAGRKIMELVYRFVDAGRDQDALEVLPILIDPTVLPELPGILRYEATQVYNALTHQGDFSSADVRIFARDLGNTITWPNLLLFSGMGLAGAGARIGGTRGLPGLYRAGILPQLPAWGERLLIAIPEVHAEAAVLTLAGPDHGPLSQGYWSNVGYLSVLKGVQGVWGRGAVTLHASDAITGQATKRVAWQPFTKPLAQYGGTYSGVLTANQVFGALPPGANPYTYALTETVKFTVQGKATHEAMGMVPGLQRGLSIKQYVADWNLRYSKSPWKNFPNFPGFQPVGPQLALAGAYPSGQFKPTAKPWEKFVSFSKALKGDLGGAVDPWQKLAEIPIPPFKAPSEEAREHPAKVARFLDAHLKFLCWKLGIPMEAGMPMANLLTALSRMRKNNPLAFEAWLYNFNQHIKDVRGDRLPRELRQTLSDILAAGPEVIEPFLNHVASSGDLRGWLTNYHNNPNSWRPTSMATALSPDFARYSDPVIPQDLGTINPAHANPFTLRQRLIDVFVGLDPLVNNLTTRQLRRGEVDFKTIDAYVNQLFELYPHMARLYLRGGNREEIIDEALNRRAQVLRIDSNAEFTIGKILFPMTQYNQVDPSHQLGSEVFAFSRDYFRAQLRARLLPVMQTRLTGMATSNPNYGRLQEQIDLLNRGALGLVTPDGRVTLFVMMDVGMAEAEPIMREVVDAYPHALSGHLRSKGHDLSQGEWPNFLPPTRLETVSQASIAALGDAAPHVLHQRLTASAEHIEKSGIRGLHTDPIADADIAPYLAKQIPPGRNLTPTQVHNDLYNFDRRSHKVDVLIRGLAVVGDPHPLARSLMVMGGDMPTVLEVYDPLMGALPTSASVGLQTYLGLFGRPNHDLTGIMGNNYAAALPRLRGWLAEAKTLKSRGLNENGYTPEQVIEGIQLAFKNAHRMSRVARRIYENPRLSMIVDDEFAPMAVEDFVARETKQASAKGQPPRFNVYIFDVNDMSAYLNSRHNQSLVDVGAFRISEVFLDGLMGAQYLAIKEGDSPDKFKRTEIAQRFVMIKEGDEYIIITSEFNLENQRDPLIKNPQEYRPGSSINDRFLYELYTHFDAHYEAELYPEQFKLPEGRRFAHFVSQPDGSLAAEFSPLPKLEGTSPQTTRLSFGTAYVRGLTGDQVLSHLDHIKHLGFEAIDAPKQEVVQRRMGLVRAGESVSLYDPNLNKWAIPPIELRPEEVVSPTPSAATTEAK
ncbi:MAG: hypothetical protein HYU97_11225 [Deltaproteobacteria bacterium]|nr:hypothetical protein [Deltaproteobacteria bacterium]